MEDMTIKISLSEAGSKILHDHGITPETYGPAHDGESVGLDLYNCGEEVVIPGRNKWIVFGEPVVTIPTGIKMSVPAGYVALIKERNGILKTGLVLRAGVIDPGDTGEIFVNLLNVGDRDTVVQPGGRLPVQLIVVPCLTDFEVISNLEFLEDASEHSRQVGSLGSSETAGVIDTHDASD